MSSHGKVLDLLDDRYLNLQDVTGNVAPFPTLVPYEHYTKTAIVYRMDSPHEVFMALIQDFTDRSAQQLGKELWTWCIQWDVEPLPNDLSLPATKKPRLDQGPSSDTQRPPRKQTPLTKVERRCLRPEIFEEDDMLRMLIDIVQIESRLVPNYIEFLYQWIDFYEGDGKALQAALRMEIPSLWLFEYHPLPLASQTPTTAGTLDGEAKTGGKDELRKAADKIGAKYIRKKPDLAALERMTEESERMQYREPKFGLRPPIDPKDEPLPPLINIPRESDKRNKYYAACFKNRQRAFWLLQEAGVSARRIANYKKLQTESPRNTPEDLNGNGFANYYKEEPFAHNQYLENEKMAKLREKQKEIAISSRLAVEVQLAAAAQSTSGRPSTGLHVPAPLIPPTPAYPRPDLGASIWHRLQQARVQHRDPTVRVVPYPVHSKLRSMLFAHATATVQTPPMTQNTLPEDGDEDGNSDGEDDEDLDGGEDDNDGDPMHITMSAQPPAVQPATAVGPNVQAFIQSLNRTELSSLIPLINQARLANVQRDFASNTVPQIPANSQPTGASGLSTALPAFNAAGPSLGLQVPLSTPANLTSGTVHQQSMYGTPSAQLLTAPHHMSQTINAPPPQIQGSNHAVDVQRYAAAQDFGPRPQAAPFSFNQAQSTTNFFPRPSQPLAQSSLRAAPPANLNLQHPHPNIKLELPMVPQIPSTSLATTPLATLAGNLSMASPQVGSKDVIPIHIYIPRIVLPHKGSHDDATDCLILGYTQLGTRTLVFTKVLFLPMTVWENTLNRVRKGHFTVLESYSPPPNHPRFAAWKGTLKNPDDVRGPHKSLYDKLTQAYGFMASSTINREEEVTKRWRVTKGPMTERDRGAVWEGWGVYIDQKIEMKREERLGAFVLSSVDGVMGAPERTEEEERHLKMINEILDEDECAVSSEEDNRMEE